MHGFPYGFRVYGEVAMDYYITHPDYTSPIDTRVPLPYLFGNPVRGFPYDLYVVQNGLECFGVLGKRRQVHARDIRINFLYRFTDVGEIESIIPQPTLPR